MKKIEQFIINCIYKGIELYMSKHRLAHIGQIETIPMTDAEFEKYLESIFADKKAVNEFLKRR